MVGIAGTQPVGYVQDGSHKREIFVDKADISVIAADPRFLILRMKTVLCKLILIAGHAPHSGAFAAEIAHWWTQLAHSIPQR